MGIFGALIGAGIGWWVGGPIGAIIGSWLGSSVSGSVHSSTSDGNEYDMGGNPYTNSQRQARGGFVASLLVLIAAVMKADGQIKRSELDYVKSRLVALLGADQAQEAVLMLRDILKQNINIQDVTLQIRVNLDYSSRLEMLHLLYGIAKADGVVSSEEADIIRTIGNGLGISPNDINAILNMFTDSVDAAYKVLEIEASASDDEVKKAYRKMAMRFHPDKVAGLGKDIQESANEKFRKVQTAYEKIKASRGMK